MIEAMSCTTPPARVNASQSRRSRDSHRNTAAAQKNIALHTWNRARRFTLRF